MKVITYLALIVILIPSCTIQKRKYTKGIYISFHRNNEIMLKTIDSKNYKLEMSTEIMSLKAETKQIQFFPVVNPSRINMVLEDENEDSILVISDKVGVLIDSVEKTKYKLFPAISNKDFASAQFKMDKNGKIHLDIQLKDGSHKIQHYSPTSYANLSKNYFAEKEEKKKSNTLTDNEIIERKLKWNSIVRFFLKFGLIFFHFIGATLFIPLLIVNSIKRRKLQRALDGLPPEEKKLEANYIFQIARKIAIAQLIGIPSSAIGGVILTSVLGALFGFGFDWELALLFAAIGFYTFLVIGGIVLMVLYFMIKKRLREDPYPELSKKTNFIKIMLWVTLILVLIGMAAVLLLI